MQKPTHAKADTCKSRHMAITERFRRRGRTGLDEAGVALRHIHHQEVDPVFDTDDHRKRLTEVHPGMTRLMAQRHIHFAPTLTRRKDTILHNRDATGKTVLIAQAFEYPLRGVTLLVRALTVFLENPVDDADKRIELRARAGGFLRRSPGGTEYRSILSIVRRSIPLLRAVSSLQQNRTPHLNAKRHTLHPPPSAKGTKAVNGGISIRPIRPLQWGCIDPAFSDSRSSC